MVFTTVWQRFQFLRNGPAYSLLQTYCKRDLVLLRQFQQNHCVYAASWQQTTQVLVSPAHGYPPVMTPSLKSEESHNHCFYYVLHAFSNISWSPRSPTINVSIVFCMHSATLVEVRRTVLYMYTHIYMNRLRNPHKRKFGPRVKKSQEPWCSVEIP